MREIEMKILGIPKKVFLETMRKLKAKKKYRVKYRVKYFDFPDQRIYKKKDLLRLRESHFDNGKIGTEVVYKIYQGVKQGCKVFEEFEWWMEGKHTFRYLSDFFRNLGLEQTLFYEKKRTLFEYLWRGKPIKFEFDEHPKIPPFVEIEAPSSRAVHEILMKLGLGKYERTPETIEQLMRRKYPKISLDGLLFS